MWTACFVFTNDPAIAPDSYKTQDQNSLTVHRSWLPISTFSAARNHETYGAILQEKKMDDIDIVKAYFATLDSADMEQGPVPF
jgi:hypothetical protein